MQQYVVSKASFKACLLSHTLDDDLSEVGVTGALLAAPNDEALLPKLPLP